MHNVDWENIPGLITFMIIGFIIVSFKSIILVDESSRFIIREYDLMKIPISKEKIYIPPNCDKILIKQKNKKGTGYYRFVLPVTYIFRSCDMFLSSESGIVRLINTDYSRSLKIAEFLKSCFNIEYVLE